MLLRRVPAGRDSQSPGQYHLSHFGRKQRGKGNISSLFLPTSMHCVLYVIVLSTFMHDIPGAADDLTKTYPQSWQQLVNYTTFSQGQTTQACHIPDLRDVLGMSMYRVWYSLCSWVCVLSGVCWVCVIWSLSLDIC